MRIIKREEDRIKGFTIYLSGDHIDWIKSHKEFNFNYFIRNMLNKYINEVNSINLEITQEDINGN